jgi:hypothetical protein
MPWEPLPKVASAIVDLSPTMHIPGVQTLCAPLIPLPFCEHDVRPQGGAQASSNRAPGFGEDLSHLGLRNHGELLVAL